MQNQLYGAFGGNYESETDGRTAESGAHAALVSVGLSENREFFNLPYQVLRYRVTS